MSPFGRSVHGSEGRRGSRIDLDDGGRYLRIPEIQSLRASIHYHHPGVQEIRGGTSSVSLSADVMLQKFNNLKGAGLVALFNEAMNGKGLALIVNDAGNTDTLQLVTVAHHKTGKPVVLATVALKAGIQECVWYHLTMAVVVSGANVSVTGAVYEHVTPTDPGSSLGPQIGSTLTFAGLLPTGVIAPGEVGIVALAINARVDSSVTNFEVSQD